MGDNLDPAFDAFLQGDESWIAGLGPSSQPDPPGYPNYIGPWPQDAAPPDGLPEPQFDFHVMNFDFNAPEPLPPPISVEYKPGPSDSDHAQAALCMPGDDLDGGKSSPVPPQARTPPDDPNEGGPELTCNAPDCKLNGKVFRNEYELRRHQKVHATEPSVLRCPAVDCDRSRRKPFRRTDKFREHMRNHGEDVLCRCPVDGCSAEPMSLGLLRLHVSCHHPWSNNQYELINGISHRNDQRICPLRGCRKGFRHSFDLYKHLTTEHDRRDRRAQQTSVRDAGFDPDHGDIICPICRDLIQVEHKESLQRHVVGHIIPKYLSEHAMAMLNRCKPVMLKGQSFVDAIFTNESIIKLGKYAMVCCPKCNFVLSMQYYPISYTIWKVIEHANPWKEEVFELYEHREALIRLVPSLQKLPIYDDLRVT